MAFGQRIRSLRQAAGLSQEELGRLLGTSQRVISTWEVDRTDVPASDVPALADALGVSVADFYSPDLVVELKAGGGKTEQLLLATLRRVLELGPERIEINVYVRGVEEPASALDVINATEDRVIAVEAKRSPENYLPAKGVRFLQRFMDDFHSLPEDEQREIGDAIRAEQG